MEIVCAGKTGAVGSNPTLSAIFHFREVGRRMRRQPRQVREEAAVTVASGCLASLEGANPRVRAFFLSATALP